MTATRPDALDLATRLSDSADYLRWAATSIRTRYGLRLPNGERIADARKALTDATRALDEYEKTREAV